MNSQVISTSRSASPPTAVVVTSNDVGTLARTRPSPSPLATAFVPSSTFTENGLPVKKNFL